MKVFKGWIVVLVVTIIIFFGLSFLPSLKEGVYPREVKELTSQNFVKEASFSFSEPKLSDNYGCVIHKLKLTNIGDLFSYLSEKGWGYTSSKEERELEEVLPNEIEKQVLDSVVRYKLIGVYGCYVVYNKNNSFESSEVLVFVTTPKY